MASGAPLADTGTTTYTVNYDQAECGCKSITVSPTGLVTSDGVDEDANVLVIASRRLGNLTLQDTAFININDVDPVPVMDSLVIQPQGFGDSVPALFPNHPAYALGYITPVAEDADGNAIDNVAFSISNPYNATQTKLNDQVCYTDTYCVLQNDVPGHVTYIATATVCGVTKADTLTFTIGWPLGAIVNVIPAGKVGTFYPSDDTVGVGATVVWSNNLNGLPADVVFDDPTGVQGVDSANFSNLYPSYLGIVIPNEGGGNISAWTTQVDTTGYNYFNQHRDSTAVIIRSVRARTFPAVGTYPYHSALYGMSGVLHVLPLYQGIP